MPNPVFDAVRTVMAIRDYAEKPVPAEVVTRIVEAGRLTASASNKQPWHFIVVREPETLRQLGSLVRTGPYTAKSALAIVVAYEKDERLAVSDCSRAIQSMMLTAWGDGLAPTGPVSAAWRVSPARLACPRTMRCLPSFRLDIRPEP